MVNYKTIEQICSNIFAGGTPSTKREDYYDGDIPWIRSGEIDFNVIESAERNITELGYKESSAKKIRKNSVVMAMTGATVAKSAVVTIETTANQSVCAMETNENIANYKYLYYCLAEDYFKIKSSAQGALTSLNLAMIKNIAVPIPSLQEQERIVGILDTFTAAIDNLKKQIEERRKQYEFYRDQLFYERTNTKMIGEITKVFSCPRVYREQWQNSGIPFWRSSDVMSYHNGVKNPRGEVFISRSLYEELSSKSDKIEEGDILVTGGGSIGIPYLKKDNKPLFVKDADLICIKKCASIIPSFLYHFFLSTDFKFYIKKITHDATIAHYTISQIKETPVPILPLQDQQRVVSILDTFGASIKNLEQQLSMRQKQYEYYRNKLLTFE